MQMRKIYCFHSFALDSAHVKFDVWNGPKMTQTPLNFLLVKGGNSTTANLQPPINTTQMGVVDGLISHCTYHQAYSGVF